MSKLHPDLDLAIQLVMANAEEQSPQFKARLTKLIENSLDGNVFNTDVKDVIELTSVDDRFED